MLICNSGALLLVHFLDFLRSQILGSFFIDLILLTKFLAIVVNFDEHRLVTHVLFIDLEDNRSSENEINIGARVSLLKNYISFLEI